MLTFMLEEVNYLQVVIGFKLTGFLRTTINKRLLGVIFCREFNVKMLFISYIF